MSQLGLAMTGDHRSRRRHRRERRRRERRHRLRGFLAVVFALVVVSALVVGGFLGVRAVVGKLAPGTAPDYPGPGTGSVSVQVKPGDSVRTIGERLVGQRVVKSVDAFVTAAGADPRSTRIQPGQYELKKQMSAAGALSVLVDPGQRQVAQVTLPEGLRLPDSLRRISKATGLPPAQLRTVAGRPSGLGLPAWANGSLEGFVFPATYEFERSVTARDALATAVERFDQAATELDLERAARQLGRSPHDVLTVASLVEAEAPASARAKVARVIYNRLGRGVPLQLDSTVNYVTGKTGITTSDADRRHPSPYNTYLHAGLPPGPINSPGADAIRAALDPTPGPWLYFVTVNPDSGATRFARTYAQHQRHVAQLQAWLRQHG